MKYILLLPFLCLFSPIAFAGTDSVEGTRIALSASAHVNIPNDEVVVYFRVEKEGKNTLELREYVNRVSAQIQKRLKQEHGVKLETISRNMQPVWQYAPNKPRQRMGWHLIQSEQATSKALDAVPEWLAAIEQSGAHLSRLQFRLSTQVIAQAQDKLQLQAMTAFKHQASLIAQSLDAKSFKIIRLNTSNSGVSPMQIHVQRPMLSRSMSANAPPSLSSGEGKLSVNIQGEIETSFVDFPIQ